MRRNARKALSKPAGARDPGGFSRPGRRVELTRSGRRTDVVVDGVPYSTFHPDRPWSGYAWDAIAAAAAWCPRRGTALLLGAGAGTVLTLIRRIRPDLGLVAIEMDEAMVAVGREQGSLDAPGTEIIVGDGLEYLARTRRRFDLVLDDMFAPGAGGLARPVEDEEAHLRRIAARLSPRGVAATNVTTDGDPPELEATVRRAHAAVFRHGLRLSPPKGWNAILASSRVALDPARLSALAAGSDPDDRAGLGAVRVRRLG